MWIAALSLIISTLDVHAQSCADTPGKWTPGLAGSTSGITTADLAREKATVAVLHKMMQEHYKPMGADASFFAVYGDYPSAGQYANRFAYGLYVMKLSCAAGARKAATETNTTLYIRANDVEAEIYQTDERERASNDGFFSIEGVPVLQNGYYHWTHEVALGFGDRGPQSIWLITYDGQLPFTFVTQREFLERKKKMIQKEKSENSSRNNMDYDAALAKIDVLLKKPATELSKPAIVSIDPTDYLVQQFVTADNPHARSLIKPNPAYFNKKIPKSSPQFFAVIMKGNIKDPVLNKAITDIPEAVDMMKLKAMLGK